MTYACFSTSHFLSVLWHPAMPHTTERVKASAGLPQMPRVSMSPGAHSTERHQLENCAKQFSHLQVFTALYKPTQNMHPTTRWDITGSLFYSPSFSCGPQKTRYLYRDVEAMCLLSGSSLHPARQPCSKAPVNPDLHVSGSNSCC